MKFTPTADGLLYEEQRLAPGLRLLAMGFGAALFLVPYPFLLHARWTPLSASTLLAGACVLLPPLLGLYFIRMGLVMPQRLRFDTRQRQIVRSTPGLFGRRVETLAFDRAERVEVVRHAGIDDPDVFELVLALRGRRPLKLGVYDSRADAEQWQRRLQELLAA